MRILVYGAGKTGTTAIYYAYKNALPGMTCVFEPKELSQVNIPEHPSLLVKSLAVTKHVQDASLIAQFDKKILIVRHPFDRLVSYILYAPHAGHGFFDDRRLQGYIDLLKKKLSSPGSVSFREIFDVVVSCRPSAARMHAPLLMLEAIADSHPDFHLLRYEDFVDGKLEGLNRYNGFEISGDPEISQNNQSVVRSKGYGDWHQWFSPQDADYFREVYRSYLDRFGYDTNLTAADPINESMTIAYTIKVANQGRQARGLPGYAPGQINMAGEGLEYQHAKNALAHGKIAKAEDLINKAISSNPCVAGFYHLRAQILMRLDDHAGAAAAVRKAITIMPDEPRFHRLLGNALRKVGNKREAAAAMETARKLQAKAAA